MYNFHIFIKKDKILAQASYSKATRNVVFVRRLMPGIFSEYVQWGDCGSTVVKVLCYCYKSEGCWFDPSWCHWTFSLT